MKEHILDGLPEAKVISLIPSFSFIRDLKRRKIAGGGRLQLDLGTNRLFGFEVERGLSNLILASVIKGIEEGDELPPVSVIRIKDRYYLDPRARRAEGGIDGGHYRSFARYVTHTPLDCTLMEDFWFPVKYIKINCFVSHRVDSYMPISDAKVMDDMSICYDIDTDEPLSVYTVKEIAKDPKYRQVNQEEASLLLKRYSISVVGTG